MRAVSPPFATSRLPESSASFMPGPSLNRRHDTLMSPSPAFAACFSTSCSSSMSAMARCEMRDAVLTREPKLRDLGAGAVARHEEQSGRKQADRGEEPPHEDLLRGRRRLGAVLLRHESFDLRDLGTRRVAVPRQLGEL